MIEEYQKQLLTLARESIETQFSLGHSPMLEQIEKSVPDAMNTHEGAFVTLKKRMAGGEEQLRGCIGNIIASRPLYLSIWSLARESAFGDPRFSPLKEEELSKVTIEISVLTVPSPVSSADEIVVGRDGVLLTMGYHRAVFLPQVATEQGWNRETMLDHLAMKAGLPPSAWKSDPCEFEVFQAEVFSE